MIIHADGPILGEWCEQCQAFFQVEDHGVENPSHQVVPVMPITEVHALRCVEHRAVPYYNRNATSEGGECTACAVVDAKRA